MIAGRSTLAAGVSSGIIKRALIAALALAALSGCARLNFLRSSSEGPWFATQLCGVRIDRTKAARLHITLSVLRPLPRGALVETEFRNPIERSVLAASRTASGDERTIEIVSPPFKEIRARPYETVTRVYASGDRRNILATHAYACESLVDERELPR